MRRLAAATVLAAWSLAATTTLISAAGPPFPAPVDDRAVYDEADVLRPEVVGELESRIDAMEAATGAEIVVYTQVDPGLTEDENAAKALALIDEWGIGRSGFDDGLVLLVGLEPDRVHGKVSLMGGSGFLGQHIDRNGLNDIVNAEFVPAARDGDLNGATLATIEAVQERMAPETVELTVARIANAALGLIGAPLVLLLTLGGAYWRWRREGDDPELTDSESILMAGPPADMTPPLATVVREGRATGHSLSTILAELASTGRIAFHNLDRARQIKSDEEPDPLTDPALEVREPMPDDDRLPLPEREAWAAIRSIADRKMLSRERLWGLNDRLADVKDTLDAEAVRLGWLTRLPGPAITAMTITGVLIALVGGGGIWLGVSLPMSGAVMFGSALVLGGIGTIGFGRAMSKRTTKGAYVDAMLTAYRRTLRKTLEQARSMGDVVAQPEVAVLATTPDEAVVWGMALGLHHEVGQVIARSLEDQRRETGSPEGAYYPVWLGSSPGSAWLGAAAGDAPGGLFGGGGGLFSGSAVPDIGGMFDALGSVGSTPPSSSSSSDGGGGFSGGGSSGGGGGSGSF